MFAQRCNYYCFRKLQSKYLFTILSFDSIKMLKKCLSATKNKKRRHFEIPAFYQIKTFQFIFLMEELVAAAAVAVAFAAASVAAFVVASAAFASFFAAAPFDVAQIVEE